jgi:hypothetical protein
VAAVFATGARPFHDLCLDPATGEVYATDPAGGLVYRLGPDLRLAPRSGDGAPNPFPSPIPGPRGIAFDPGGDEGRGSLHIVGLEGRGAREVALDGTPLGPEARFALDGRAGLTLGFAFHDGREQLVTVDPVTGELLFLARDGTLASILQPADDAGALDGGIAYDRQQGTLLATSAALVRELDAGGAPTGVEVPLDLAPSADEGAAGGPGGGLEVDGDTLLVALPAANALVRLFLDPPGGPFVRGDVDGSGQVDVSDPAGLVRYYFRDGAAPPCRDAADANDDGSLDLSDPVFVLFFLFLDGEAPPAPFPEPGEDGTRRDPLDCAFGGEHE